WGSSSTDRNYWLGKIDASTIAFYVDNTQSVTTNLNLINNNIWHLVTGVANSASGELRIYVDGVLRNTASYDGTSITGTSDLHIGNSPGEVSQEWNGQIDEVRVSEIACSTDLLLTSYRNQIDPTNFIIVGNEREFDILPPTLDDFGVDDLGTGTGAFWALMSDNLAGVATVTVKINETEYSMVDNGTHWVYEKAVEYQGFYEFQITNASDSVNNYLSAQSNVKNCTITNDNIAPDVVNRDYINAEGRFYANVTDSWGTIDTILINVTYHSVTLPSPSVAVMVRYQDFGNNIFGYLNDTIDMVTGDISFTIIVNDTHGNSYTSSPKDSYVFKNTPPVVSGVAFNTAPYYSNTLLELTYNFTDAEGHAEDGTEIRWFKNNGSGFQLQVNRNDSYTIPASNLYKGDEWYVSVKPRDGQDFGTLVNSSTVTIANTPPTIALVQITPSSAYTTTTLSLVNSTSDYDGDPISNFYVEWFVSTVHDPAFDNQFIIYPSSTNKDESWQCRIRAYDGTDNSSDWMYSNSVQIRNTIPNAVNLSIAPIQLYNTSALIANWDISDADGDSEIKSLAIIYWYKYGVPQPHLTNSSYVNPGNTSKDELWSFKIQIWDGTNYSSLTEIDTPVEILNSAPSVDNAQILVSTPKTGDDLSISWQFDDDDNDDQETPIIIWYLDNEVLFTNYTTLPASKTTKGDYWHFGIKVFDGEDYSVQINSSQVLIENTVPSIDSLHLSDDATTLDDLVASWNTIDNDGRDPLEFNVTFYLNGIKNASWLTTSETTLLKSGNTTKSDLWYFTIEAYDGEAYSGIYTLASNVTILNSIPIVSDGTATFNDTSPDTSQAFNITYQFSDNDDDFENKSKIIVYWFVDSGGGFVYRSEFQNHTLIYPDNTSSGEIWYYKLRVSDGESYSLNVTSILGVGIGGSTNNAPWAENLTLTPFSPNTTQNLVANYSFFDADADSEVATEIRWYKNNVLQSDYNNLLVVPSTETEKGQEWNFTVKVFDGTEWSLVNVSNTLMISNAEPEVSNLDLTDEMLNSEIFTDENLVATWEAFDYDTSDVLNYTITWYCNGILNHSWVTYDLSAILDKGNTSKNTNWTYTIKVFDGEVYSTTVSLNYNITIRNTPPIAENLTITTNPKSIDNLISGWNYYDIDLDSQDTLNAIITWFKNGENQTSLYKKTIVEAGNLSKNQRWWFTVQVFDGENHSIQIYESLHVDILNTEPLTSGSQLPVPVSPTRETGISLNLNEIFLAFNDPDLDNIQLAELKWYKDNILQSDLTGNLIVEGNLIAKGEIWNYTAIVSDGLANSTLLFSQEILILNSQPSIINTYFSESDVRTINDLEIVFQASDVDNDPITVENVLWYR
ncbi:MAG: LamG-like jellyroll fold domain-containing protein, partial [Promethearchaeota archaeon]